jgi:hypothetical protein
MTSMTTTGRQQRGTSMRRPVPWSRLLAHREGVERGAGEPGGRWRRPRDRAQVSPPTDLGCQPPGLEAEACGDQRLPSPDMVVLRASM